MSEYEEFLAAAANGTARTVFENGSTYGVYTNSTGRTAYQHFCYGDERESYATRGFEIDGAVYLIPAQV